MAETRPPQLIPPEGGFVKKAEKTHPKRTKKVMRGLYRIGRWVEHLRTLWGDERVELFFKLKTPDRDEIVRALQWLSCEHEYEHGVRLPLTTTDEAIMLGWGHVKGIVPDNQLRMFDEQSAEAQAIAEAGGVQDGTDGGGQGEGESQDGLGGPSDEGPFGASGGVSEAGQDEDATEPEPPPLFG